MNGRKLPGVRFDTTTRTIEAGYKFAGQTIPMLRVVVTDRNLVHPVDVGVRMLEVLYAHHKKDWAWREKSIDRLAGTDQLRAAVEQGTVDALLAKWAADEKTFAAKVKPYLLYK